MTEKIEVFPAKIESLQTETMRNEIDSIKTIMLLDINNNN